MRTAPRFFSPESAHTTFPARPGSNLAPELGEAVYEKHDVRDRESSISLADSVSTFSSIVPATRKGFVTTGGYNWKNKIGTRRKIAELVIYGRSRRTQKKKSYQLSWSVRVHITVSRRRAQTIPAPDPNHTTPCKIFCQRQPDRLQLIQCFFLAPNSFPTARSDDLDKD